METVSVGAGAGSLAAAKADLRSVRSELAAFYLERDEMIDVSLTALVGRLDCLALGDAGVAKTSIIQSLMSHISGGVLFETQLFKLMMPDSLFGPISVSGLTNDQYRHVTAGRLPDAHVAFLSEMSEGSAHILNSLRILLSQRQFEQDGRLVTVPLMSCFFDSNRLPEAEDGLGPLVDRLVLRVVVPDISDHAFGAFLTAALARPTYRPITLLSVESLALLQQAVAAVTIPPSVIDSLVSLRVEARDAGIAASPRRWKQSLRALQATALLDGRDVVEEDDMACYGHILWNSSEERQAVLAMTARRANPVVGEALALADQIISLVAEGVQAAKTASTSADAEAQKHAEEMVMRASLGIRTAKKKLFGLLNDAKRQGRGESKVQAQMDRADAAHKSFGRETGMMIG